jgi:hypothetical protein
MIEWMSKGGRPYLITAISVAIVAAALGHVGYAVGFGGVALLAYPKLNKPKDQ